MTIRQLAFAEWEASNGNGNVSHRKPVCYVGSLHPLYITLSQSQHIVKVPRVILTSLPSCNDKKYNHVAKWLGIGLCGRLWKV